MLDESTVSEAITSNAAMWLQHSQLYRATLRAGASLALWFSAGHLPLLQQVDLKQSLLWKGCGGMKDSATLQGHMSPCLQDKVTVLGDSDI